MASLPESVVAAIVRGMSAYMQGAKRTDLPAPLRPLQGKHLKMLTARKDDIVAALEDDGVRALVLEWLDDRPAGISKADVEVLRAAASRNDGWAEEVASSVPTLNPQAKPKPKAKPKKDPASTLAQEKERTRKARDEARRAKEDAALSTARLQREAESRRAEVDRLTTEVRALEKLLSTAEKERDAAVREMDREVRKARRRAEKAEAALTQAKTDTRAIRADLTRAKSSAATPTPRKKPKVQTPASSVPPRRQRLGAPQGRLSEDPETLVAWLAASHVHLLVDGYNVSKAKGGFGDLRLETQRTRLLQELGKLARHHKIKATVIFDGSDIGPGTSRRARGPVEVEYSRSDEIADDHLIAKLEGLPKWPVIVATNDRELQHRAARLGATIATSDQLLGLIR